MRRRVAKRSNTAKKIFYSYSHRDSVLRRSLETHLSLLIRDGLVTDWYDAKILPGTEWNDEIARKLEESDIILLLVSMDFVKSDFCWGNEMTRALERHQEGTAAVIPIILKPMERGWKTTTFGKLQALPSNAKPVTKWRNRDEAWADVVNGIRAYIEG
jgi:TIR domain